ncbi:MAG: site-2 protease family protein [Acidimicrobiales bacterium]
MTDIQTSPPQTGAQDDPPGEVVVHDGPKSNPVALVLLVAGALILGRKLGVNAPLIILGIAVMIFFHELGHFITAKWTGMKATEFFLGFGPTLWSFRRGETEYGLKLIPAGAYVKIIGMHNLEEVDPADEPRAFRQKSYPRRLLVASAGSGMHFIMATLLFFICFSFLGVPDENKWYVSETVPGAAADQAGLIAGDRILTINGEPVNGFAGVGPVLGPLYDQPLTMQVLRDGQEIQITGTAGWRLSESGAAGIDGLLKYEQVLAVEGQPVTTYSQFLSMVEVGKTYTVRAFGAIDATEFDTKVAITALDRENGAVGYLGIVRGEEIVPLGVVEGSKSTMRAIGRTSKAAVTGLGVFASKKGFNDTFSNAFNKEAKPSVGTTPETVITDDEREAANDRDSHRAISIIGAARAGKQIADENGARGALLFYAAFNIFIGVLNLLPLLPLDGGHIVVATYERIRSRKGRMYHADFAKLLPLTYVVVALMASLMLFTGLRDIVDPLKF